VAAPLVLRQRGVVPPLGCIEAHQPTVHLLLQRSDGEKLEAMTQRLLQPPAMHRFFHQSRVDGAGEEPKALALGRKPLLEPYLGDR